MLGLAGSNVGTYAQQLEAILPFRHAKVETDALIALEGAVGPGNGAMAILGTGTAYMVRKEGVTRAIGGWGFQVGDQGSGARIGRDLLELTLLAHDGIREASPLTREMLRVFRNDPQDLVEFTTNAKPGDFGGFAPKVFEHAAKGDSVAQAIVGKAVADVEASLAALDLERRRPALPARRARAALCAAPFRALPGDAEAAAAGCARRRGRHGRAHLRQGGARPWLTPPNGFSRASATHRRRARRSICS